MINKKTILTAIVMCVGMTGISAGTTALPSDMPTMQYSYCNNPLDNANLGVGLNTTYHSCIILPAVKTKSFGGNYITEVSIGTGSLSDTNGELWLSYDLNDEPFYTQPIELVEDKMAMSYQLETPHLIETGKDLYIGWSCHADWDYSPIKGESDRSGSIADPRGDIVGFEDEEGRINWKHLADTRFGNLLMSLTIQGDNLPTYDIAIENVKFDPYVSAGSTLTVTGNVRNYGSKTIDSYMLSYRVGSNPPKTETPQCWEMNTGNMYGFSFTVDKFVVGPNTLTITLANPGGHGDVNPDDNTWSGSFICYSTSHSSRNVLLEQFSTAFCAQCPAGHDRIEAGIAEFDNVIWVTHHSGYYEDDMTTDDDRALTWFYGSPQTFAPAIMFDRTNFSSDSYLSEGPVKGVGQSDEIKDFVIMASSQPSLARIEATSKYDEESRELVVDLNGASLVDLSTRNTTVNIYLVEDNIVGIQTIPGSVLGDYIHNNVFRKALTETWGDPVYWDNKSFKGQWTYTLPDNFKAENMRVVAFLSNYNSLDCNDCMVLDSCVVPLTDESGVAMVDSNSWKAYGGDRIIVIDGEVNSIRVIGTDGVEKKVLNSAGSYSFPAGMYILTDGTTSTKTVVR